MKKKKIDWFFMIFLFFALIIFIILAFFINKKLIYINKNLNISNIKNTEQKIDDSDIKENYFLFLNNLKSNLNNIDEVEKKDFILDKIENDIFSVKVPDSYRDFHLNMALFFTKFKFDINNNKNKELFLEYLNDFLSNNL